MNNNFVDQIANTGNALTSRVALASLAGDGDATLDAAVGQVPTPLLPRRCRASLYRRGGGGDATMERRRVRPPAAASAMVRPVPKRHDGGAPL
jgi:hypothetical protein